jgi:hypothetical protein
MKYNQYKTLFEVLKMFKQYDVYYRSLLASITEAMTQTTNRGEGLGALSMNASQVVAEWYWHKSGKPYYNIHPSLINTFSKCTMDIPANLVRFPFPTFSINLPSPEEGNPLIINEQYYIKSFLCHWSNNASLINAARSMGLKTLDGRSGDENRMIIWIDIGETEKAFDGKDLPIYTYRQLAYVGDESIDVALHKLPPDDSANIGVVINEETILKCIKLMISVCFLVESNDPLVLPDILAKDRFLLEDADEEKLKQLQEKARLKDKFGWIIGIENGRKIAGGEHQLSYAHIRTGHWHKVLFGVGKKQFKVIWYRPVTVRPDLPMKL